MHFANFVAASRPFFMACSPNRACRHALRSILALVPVILGTTFWVSAQVAITTYHYDNYRTGWNQSETQLTPATVSSSKFGLLETVALDDRVDAQPLVVPGVTVTAGNFQGMHNVVYVATANNTVYMVDTDNGTVLLTQNLGPPALQPPGCASGKKDVGITSTPVIDSNTNTLYVMAYTADKSGPTYRIHALDLGNLGDKVTPQVVSASHLLNNAKLFTFNGAYQRQRPALLLANGNVYAGFGSFCDLNAKLSRGWLLGWNAASLTPLPSNQIENSQAASPHSFFLSSIWMSGYGPATDDAGNVLFITGNSDPSGTTYDGVSNIQESVVKVSPDLNSVLDLFTPTDQASLDQTDGDFGSGGVLVLPDQAGPIPHLAVAAGKEGNMFLLNEDSLGGYSTIANQVLGTYPIGECWCGQSYFVDPDGASRIVSSGGPTVMVWKLTTNPNPVLTKVGASNFMLGGQDPGRFTTVSSNGTASPIIWALPRAHLQSIYLYAFDPESQKKGIINQIFMGTAGAWPLPAANANLVPVVANGKVFVASYMQLSIFGLKESATPKTQPN